MEDTNIPENTATKGSVAYWRGTVDQRLNSLDNKVEEICRKIDRVENKIDTVNERLGNGSRFITWEFIREKFTVPIVLAAITFFLFSVLPAILICIYLTVGKTP